MNPETEAVLKAMGFVAGDAERGGDAVMYFVPHTDFHVHVHPSFTPVSLRHAIWNKGKEAARDEIRKAHQSYLDSMK